MVGEIDIWRLFMAFWPLDPLRQSFVSEWFQQKKERKNNENKRQKTVNDGPC